MVSFKEVHKIVKNWTCSIYHALDMSCFKDILISNCQLTGLCFFKNNIIV